MSNASRGRTERYEDTGRSNTYLSNVDDLDKGTNALLDCRLPQNEARDPHCQVGRTFDQGQYVGSTVSQFRFAPSLIEKLHRLGLARGNFGSEEECNRERE